MENRCN